MPAFRDNLNLKSSDLDLYMEGNYDPDPADEKLCGYPRSYFLNPNMKILDISKPSALFFKSLESHSPDLEVFVRESILSREQSVYPITHIISAFAHKNGFHGIYYRSVRIPKDWHFCGGYNLVLFAEKVKGISIVGKSHGENIT